MKIYQSLNNLHSLAQCNARTAHVAEDRAHWGYSPGRYCNSRWYFCFWRVLTYCPDLWQAQRWTKSQVAVHVLEHYHWQLEQNKKILIFTCCLWLHPNPHPAQCSAKSREKCKTSEVLPQEHQTVFTSCTSFNALCMIKAPYSSILPSTPKKFLILFL